MEKLSSTSANSSNDWVQIEAMEAHGWAGHNYRDPKPFDIKEGSDDKVINIYANFQDKKPYIINKLEGYWINTHLIVDAGTHVKIPEGYALYVFSDDEIISKYGIRLYYGGQVVFTDSCLNKTNNSKGIISPFRSSSISFSNITVASFS